MTSRVYNQQKYSQTSLNRTGKMQSAQNLYKGESNGFDIDHNMNKSPNQNVEGDVNYVGGYDNGNVMMKVNVDRGDGYGGNQGQNYQQVNQGRERMRNQLVNSHTSRINMKIHLKWQKKHHLQSILQQTPTPKPQPNQPNQPNPQNQQIFPQQLISHIRLTNKITMLKSNQLNQNTNKSQNRRQNNKRGVELLEWFTCPICCEEIGIYDGFELKQWKYRVGCRGCLHYYCYNCVLEYVRTKINQLEKIVCPNTECGEQLQLQTNQHQYQLKQNNKQKGFKHQQGAANARVIFQNLDTRSKNKYRKNIFYLQAYKKSKEIQNPQPTNQNSTNPLKKHPPPNQQQILRMCPDEDCIYGILRTDKKLGLHCTICSKQYCPQCLMPSHKSSKCNNTQIKHLKASYNYRQCVRCKRVIQKNDGCNHMVCMCKYEFCYVCGEEWSEVHPRNCDRGHLAALGGFDRWREAWRLKSFQEKFFYVFYMKCLQSTISKDTILGKLITILIKTFLFFPVFLPIFILILIGIPILLLIALLIAMFLRGPYEQFKKFPQLPTLLKILFIVFLPLVIVKGLATILIQQLRRIGDYMRIYFEVFRDYFVAMLMW